MDIRSASLKLLLPVFTAGAMVLSAGAQQAAQPIIFSSSQNDSAAPSVPTLAPQTPEQPNFVNTFQAPPENLNFNPSPDAGPLPQMPQSPHAGNQQLQKILEERKNWTLMTPEEIFGVTTPEKILGVHEYDASGQKIELTQVERYLARQNEPQTGATNGSQTGAAGGYWDSSGNQEGDSFNPDGTRRENSRLLLSGLLNPSQDNGTLDKQNDGENWFKSFAAPATPKPNPEQQEVMEKFRQLLAPSPVAAAGTVQSGSSGKFFPAPATPNPLFDQPTVNPIGASFTPLSSGIGKPQGLTPLPGVTGQNNPQPAAVPSWAPQPAPWLSQGPQPFEVPQRKF